ncbi:MAG: hypothetical protein J6Y44_03300 [Clostridia bacterium]|nr:hypothetical protein [Clostridia bacterium]
MNVSSYLLSITALVILTELTRMILPKGKTRRVVEILFSLVIVATLLSPVINVKNFAYLNELGSEFTADYAYSDYIDGVYGRTVKINAERWLDEKNFPYSSVEVDCERGSIKKVKIYCSKKVIEGNFEHINSSEVTTSLASLLGINAEVVEFVERETG